MNDIVLPHEQRSRHIASQCAETPTHSKHAEFGITVLVLCILVLLGAVPSFCQMAVNPERTGVVPYGTYEGNGIDHIDMTNGRLHLSIPLYSLPQKGSLSLSFSAIVSGATTYDAKVEDCTQTSCQFNYKLGASIGPHIDFDQRVHLMTVVPSLDITTEAGDDGAGQWEDGYMDVSYIHQVMDGDGNLHYLGYDPSTNYMTLRSADGSGYLEQLSDPNGYKNGATGPIYDAKGIRYDSTGITDPNGNHITYPSPSDIITDSLGRSVPLPGTGPAVDISNCPDLNNPSQPVTSASEWDLPGPTDAGGTVKYIICETKFYYHTNFLFHNGNSYTNNTGDPPVLNTYTEASGQVTAIQSIVNPDGTAWSFEYDGSQDPSAIAYGDLLKVHLPSGGTISYTYQTLPTCTPEEEGYPKGNANPSFEPRSRVVTSRTLTQLDGSTQTWNYLMVTGFPNLTSTVYRPDGNSTVYQFSPLGGSSECSYVATNRTDYQGSPTSGVVKRTTQKTYFTQEVPEFIRSYQKTYYYATVIGDPGSHLFAEPSVLPPLEVPFPHTVTTTLDQGPPVTTTYTYDAGFENVQPWCDLENDADFHDCQQWDFTHRAAHAMLGRVTSVSTTGSDGHGGTLTSTKTTKYQAFDSTGVTNSAYYNANLLDFPHVVTVTGSAGNIGDTTYNYDEGNGSPAGVHGNLTSTVLNGGAPTSTVYNSHGMPVTSIDGNGNATTYTYADSSSASPTKVCRPVTNGVSHCSYYTWDPNTGEMLTSKDQNNVLTQYSYDSMGRATKIDAAVGTPSERATAFDYETPNVTRVSADKDVLNDGKLKSSVTVDGFGRTIHTTNAAGATVDTTYDSVGNVASVSNPYFSTSDPTYGITSFAYDALGRKIDQCQQDNSSSPTTTCTPGSSYQRWQYNGSTVTFTDESGRQWARTSDALGRLAKVVEDPGGSNLETDYGYDNLGNLTTVTQWGGPNGSPNPRTRTFSYDSLSDLVQSFNPETGWVCYGTTPSNAPANGSNCTRDYDGNRNLKAKTDARGVQTAYTYDALNRMTGKSYSDGTPPINYVWDLSAISYSPVPADASRNLAVHPANVIGRLTAVCQVSPGLNSCGTLDTFSYDAMGRMTERWTSTPGYNMSGEPVFKQTFGYDRAGNLTSIIYPDGRHVTRSWDSAGHLTGITYADWNGTSVNYQYLKTASYFPDGSPSSMTFGNGAVESYSKNKRFQPTEIKAQANVGGEIQTVFDKQYNYTSSCQGADNGNIMQIMDALDNARSQGFCYDSLNRIASFSNGDGSMQQSYTIDPWGNMTHAGTLNFSASFGTNNRLIASGVSYDAAGNTITLPNPVGGAFPLAYDAENRLTNFNNGGAVYSYGGEGNRSRKDAGGSWTEYLYFNGRPMAEKTSDGRWSDYIYANGRRIARADSYDARTHLSGTTTVVGHYAAWDLPFSHYTIQPGDKISWRQYQDGVAEGGVALQFTDGTNTNWTTVDTDGQVMNSDTTENAWHYRTVDLSGFAGKTADVLWIDADARTPVGPWNSYFADIAIYSTDGTVTPIYYRQSSTGFTYFSNGDISNPQAEVQISNSGGDAENPLATTTYYQGDQIGSTRMLTAAAGWPVSSSNYYPYGQGPQPEVNHYLFTGKERDTESGLDFFGARYYASTMGRFITPDWAAKAEPVPYADLNDPQTLNLYAYVRNNPIALADPDGHFHWCGESGAEICEGGAAGGSDTQTTNQGAQSTQPQNGDPSLPTVFKKGQQPAPTNPDGSPQVPPVPVPGAPEGTGWKWNPNSQNPRGGTWGPDKWKGPNPPNGSWDPSGHWDINLGKGEPVDHYDPNGNPITPGQAHPGNAPTERTMMDRMRSITPGPILRFGTAGVVIYIIIDEGSRLYPPRNLVPVP